MHKFLLIPLAALLMAATNINSRVEIRSEWRSCQTAEDCQVVQTTCNDCGGADVINNGSAEAFDLARGETCSHYRGMFCNSMISPDTALSCREHVCRLGN